MLRSFDYAVVRAVQHRHLRPDDVPRLEQWGALWQRWVTATFLRRYLETTEGASFIPSEPTQLEVLLDFHLLDKCAYELSYELNNRPEWVHVPLQGLVHLIEQEGVRGEPAPLMKRGGWAGGRRERTWAGAIRAKRRALVPPRRSRVPGRPR